MIIGSGSFGSVIFGLDIKQGLMMAIKRIYIENNQIGEKRIQNLQQEVQILSEL